MFCDFHRVGSSNEGKTTIIISNSQIEILVSYTRSRNVNVSMSFPNRNFEGNFCIMCLASHFDIIESWKLIVVHCDIYYAKQILNTFVCVEVRILVGKWNIHEAHVFPKPLLQICIWKRLFVFKYPVKCKQKISKFSYLLLKLM